MKLLQPVNMTSEQLKGAADMGRTFGKVIGAVISTGLHGFAALARIIGWVIGKAGAVSAVVAKIPVIGTPMQLARSAFGANDAAPALRRAPLAPGAARGRAAPRAPGVAGRGGGVTDASTHTYHITQQPGESSEALARRIEAQRRRQAGVDRRGALVDGVRAAG